MARAKRSKIKVSELEGQPDPRSPVDSAGLLSACQGALTRLEADLLDRARSSPAVTQALEARYQAEKAAERTSESLAGWTALLATQVAAAWVLSCVFVRTLEDRGLLKQVRLAGPGAEDSQCQFFQLAPSLTERDYLLTVFRELAHHPAAKDLFDAEHSPVWKLSPSGAAAKELLALFRMPNTTTPALRFGQASTRFLGDLYQDISEDIRKRYALLQTPDFIEEFILDRTLEPAILRFGLDDTTLIDPTCGSGHFLLGAFDRLFEHRLRAQPGIDPRLAAIEALDCVYGADINPYAVAIARFRLTLSFLAKAGYAKLADAPALPLHLVVADSLRINAQHPQTDLWQQEGVSSKGWLVDVFLLEDERAARDVLLRQYAAVVANPPYITPKDRAQRTKYAEMYKTCFMNYALSVPFCERIFQLARPRGYTGQITANSFMKREFGSKLIESYLPTVNLERIVNTSGAFIPGHATPTVLLFGTNEPPQGRHVLAVLAKRGEPTTPADPSQGLVWCSLVDHCDEVGFDNDYISVARVGRDSLEKHPWSLGGGGTSELKELLEERAAMRLSDVIDDVGFSVIVGEDELFMRPKDRSQWAHLPRIPIVNGDDVRDWLLVSEEDLLSPFSNNAFEIDHESPLLKELWPWRTVLKNRVVSGSTTMELAGKTWFDVRRLSREKHKTKLSIVFAHLATHNHFVLDGGGKVYNRSAPIIKLPESATEDDHLELLAYLNSSTACFWMKQVFHDKGSTAVDRCSQAEKAKVAYEFTGTGLEALPVPDLKDVRDQLCANARALLVLGAKRDAAIDMAVEQLLHDGEIGSTQLEDLRLLETMITFQEEIDWLVYESFGFGNLRGSKRIDSFESPRTPLGSRPFEIALASHGETISIDGYALHGDVGAINDDIHREVIRRRVACQRENAEVRIIEDAHYKRRWAIASKSGRVVRFEDRVRDALAQAIYAQLEDAARLRTECWIWSSIAEAADIHIEALSWLLGRAATVLDLKPMINVQSVPFARALRFRESGIRRSQEWEMLWEAQRAEDGGQKLSPFIPGKYGDEDYASDIIANLRGKLDVPEERFISYPGCESDNDSEPVYGWAGWDHLQRAKALASLYLNRKDVEGWAADRLTPVLAGLLELIPWVKQWHNEPSEEFGGLRMGDYYEQFLDGECRLHALTYDDLRSWRPTKKVHQKAYAKAANRVKATRAQTASAGSGHAENVASAASNGRAEKHGRKGPVRDRQGELEFRPMSNVRDVPPTPLIRVEEPRRATIRRTSKTGTDEIAVERRRRAGLPRSDR